MDDDPITTLVDDLSESGSPPLSWVVRWSSGGRDPVAAAWDASCDPWAMALLLMHTARDNPLGRYQLVNNQLGRSSAATPNIPRHQVLLGEGTEQTVLLRNAEGAAEIRRRVPTPPTLRAVLQRGRWRR